MRTRSFQAVVVLAALALQVTVFAGEFDGARPAPDYMRYAEDARSARLEVAVKSFKMPGGQTVDLIGVVHIADDAYYQKLNRRFDRYDSVLFELVGDPQRLMQTAPQVLKQEYDRQYAGVVSMSSLQIAVGKYLNLAFQLGEIDYTKPNMVHADVGTAEFAKMQQERGETMLTLLLRAMNAQFTGTADTAALSELDIFSLIRILLSPDAATEFKKTLARMFDQGEALTQLMEGEAGSAVLSGRNEVVVRKIQDILADHRRRRIAVLYGGGHMPGIETTLIGKLHAKPAGEEWLAAWTMPK
jgi:hypothetical protein